MPECAKCGVHIRTGTLCEMHAVEQRAGGVEHGRDVDPVCVGCEQYAPEGSYSENRRGMWFCPGCSGLELRREERLQVAAETPDTLAGTVQWAVGDSEAFPEEDPATLDAGFESATEHPRAVADGGQQFEDLPTPDRFFQAIGDAEVEMEPMDRDEVRFQTNHVPGGRFGFELTASYSYASYDCRQIITLDRDGAEALRDRLTEILENDSRGAGGEI